MRINIGIFLSTDFEMKKISLYPHQKEAVDKLDSGFILCGGVGSGKSMTALAYYYFNECGGKINSDGELLGMKNPKFLYIITTARKRDTQEWESECSRFGLKHVAIDSWNNIYKYESSSVNAFYIFDEQRVVGSGSWVKSFLKITKQNRWILLSATPGDTWMDYIPVFVANGFYKNRTEFLRLHAVYNRYAKYPKVDRFVDCGRLEHFRRKITVTMDYRKPSISHFVDVLVPYNEELYYKVAVERWNPYESKPIKDISEACYLMRRTINEDERRIDEVVNLMKTYSKIIIFYNFNYELDLLRKLSSRITIREWNGHLHEEIPSEDRWLYLVQYTAGAEGWNCTETNVVIFYSQNYSYKCMIQAAGRIDRLNSPFSDLYYYTLRSSSPIDLSIFKALRTKRNFNEKFFIEGLTSR